MCMFFLKQYHRLVCCHEYKIIVIHITGRYVAANVQ